MIKSVHRAFAHRSFATLLKPEVCIVGGGPAGATLAACLAKSNHFDAGENKKIVLIDPMGLPEIETYHKQDRVPEPRVVTLSPSSLRLLESCDALSQCNHEYITPFKSMLVYEEAGSAYMHFKPEQATSPLV